MKTNKKKLQKIQRRRRKPKSVRGNLKNQQPVI
jgi:hypothetical protein